MRADPRRQAEVRALLPQGLLARAALVLLGLVLLVLAFFFMVAVAIVFSVAAAGALLRWWWLSRKLGAARSPGVIEGDYVVVERSGPEPLEKPKR